jgi:hypothetical protein
VGQHNRKVDDGIKLRGGTIAVVRWTQRQFDSEIMKIIAVERHLARIGGRNFCCRLFVGYDSTQILA